jgi:hypothetical protein
MRLRRILFGLITVGDETMSRCASTLIHRALSLTLWVVVGVVFLAVGGSGVLAQAGPKVVIPQHEFDFGSVSQGQKVEHEFVVRNDGDADLIIQRIAPSCGCTAAQMSAGAVKPGSSEKIKVAFNTAGFYGSKTKSVSILTNSRDNPEVILKLKGVVVRGVSVAPERIDFGDISPGSSQTTRTQEFVVELSPDSGREIAAVRTFSKFLTVSPAGGSGNSKRYSVSMIPGAPRGEFRDRVVIEFTKDEHSAINVPVIASIQGDLRVIPSSVSFGIIEGKDPIERRIRFENTSGSSVSITGVSASHSAVTASFKSVEEGKRGVVIVTLDPTKVTSDLKSTLEIKTTHPEESSISVGVFGVVAPK